MALVIISNWSSSQIELQIHGSKNKQKKIIKELSTSNTINYILQKYIRFVCNGDFL